MLGDDDCENEYTQNGVQSPRSCLLALLCHDEHNYDQDDGGEISENEAQGVEKHVVLPRLGESYNQDGHICYDSPSNEQDDGVYVEKSVYSNLQSHLTIDSFDERNRESSSVG